MAAISTKRSLSIGRLRRPAPADKQLRLPWSAEEEIEFAAIFWVCWSLPGTAGRRAALETLEEWHADRLWRRAQAHVAHEAAQKLEMNRLVQLLRVTDPARIAAEKGQ